MSFNFLKLRVHLKRLKPVAKFTQSSCFKEYDIRGKLNIDINEEIAFRIGYATAKALTAKKVVVGYDARESSPNLSKSVIKAVQAYGADVLNLGLTGTEEVYCAVANFGADAGVEITASHNPINYNGMKIVKSGSQPLTADDFAEIKLLVERNNFTKMNSRGQVHDFRIQARAAYIKKIISFIDLENLKPLKIVLNSGNGAAGPVVDELENYIKNKCIHADLIRVHHQPDPNFPNGIPNPLLEENRASTSDAVKKVGADFGVAFDGDFDRCFFFDELGNFIPSEYIVGMLAEFFLRKENRATIIHDPRVIFNTVDIVKAFGGNAVSSKTGHAYVKSEMRAQNAVYGGEMSAHHYFRDFNYCDSGMIPWLLVWELLSVKDISLSELLKNRRKKFPSSGEMNFNVINSEKYLRKIDEKYSSVAQFVDRKDGISLSFENWRFNVRQSKTEEMIRLNVETKGDEALLFEKTKELSSLILTI